VGGYDRLGVNSSNRAEARGGNRGTNDAASGLEEWKKGGRMPRPAESSTQGATGIEGRGGGGRAPPKD